MSMHDDKAEKRRQAEARRLSKQEVEARSRVFHRLASDPEGRDFLWWLLDIGRLGQQPFSTNALQTAFSCGELNIGQQVFAAMSEASPSIYLTLVTERQERNESNRSNTGPGGDTDSGGNSDASSDAA